MASENSCYRENFAKLSNASSPEFHIPHYPWGWWNRSIPLMLKRFIAVNGKSWNPSSHWRLWLLVEQKHLLWGERLEENCAGKSATCRQRDFHWYFNAKNCETSIRTFVWTTQTIKGSQSKKAKTVCWQVEKDWEVNGFGEGCPVLQNSTSGWTPVLKGTM